MTLVVVGWSAGRVLSSLPDQITGELTRAPQEMLIGPAEAEIVVAPTVRRMVPRPFVAERSAEASIKFLSRTVGVPVPASTSASIVLKIAKTPTAIPIQTFRRPVSPDLPPPGLPRTNPSATRPGRWSGSAWAIARAGGSGTLLSPLLGGSQAGVRIAYRLDGKARIAAFARAATPLRNGPVELAAGAQWRPTKAPVTLFAEVRAVSGQAVPAAGAFGGGAIALPGTFRLEGYGQAGVIDRNGVNGFGDGQVRLVRPLGPIEAGAGVWGAVQRGASRLDIGPSLAVPIAAAPLALRITLDWRHRLAGNARPTSGLALSLGADF